MHCGTLINLLYWYGTKGKPGHQRFVWEPNLATHIYCYQSLTMKNSQRKCIITHNWKNMAVLCIWFLNIFWIGPGLQDFGTNSAVAVYNVPDDSEYQERPVVRVFSDTWSSSLLCNRYIKDIEISIGYVNKYPTMHYFGNPRHIQSMIAFLILTEFIWKFQWTICIVECC